MALAPTPLEMTKFIPLITGGGSGLGLGFLRHCFKHGCPKILISGRREDVLKQVCEEYSGRVFYKVSDVGKEGDRAALFEWVRAEHSDCNAIINNAGIQRRLSPAQDTGSWAERASEIAINFEGPVHLCTLFIPYFLSKAPEQCVVANVSSGLAFVPFAAGPVYGATKAAIHSYCVAMRYSLQGTNTRMVEIVPPAVKSNLGGSHDFGEDTDEYCGDAIDKLAAGLEEFGFKFSETGRTANRETLDAMSLNVASQMKVVKYS